MRNRTRNSIKIEGLTLDLTSSLNKFLLCECGRKFGKKPVLATHVVTCNGIPVSHYCHWCNLTFKNRGNLVLHAKFLHGDDSFQETEKKFKCNGCDARYDSMWKLKYHIRGNHFNLISTTPAATVNPVNQVWYEKGLNTENLVEIRKAGPNKLILTPMAPDPTVKVSDHNLPEKVDLHSLYPTGRSRNAENEVQCKICKKSYKARDLKKHTQEAHQKDFAKHKCNNCNMTFKRSYIYLKHVCNKTDGRFKRKKVDGVKQFGKGGITITNVSSLRPVEID